MDEKIAFIAECLRGELPMTVLCERYGISRDTGYRLLGRYREEGRGGLQPRSRAPHRHGMTMAEEMAAAIMALRRQRPFWGPKKLRAVLQRRDPKQRWPAPSTIGDLLRRAGLSEPRRRRRRAVPLTQPFLPVHEPNDLWCIDFKGWFRTADGQRCDPLTITDADSRFLIECRIVPETIEAVQPVVEQAFRELGLPRAIRSDNGVPFASSSCPGGLTRLSVQWVKLGIRLERIEPGAPQQNGRHTSACMPRSRPRPRARRRPPRPSNKSALTASATTLTTTARMKRWARCRRPAAIDPRRGPIPVSLKRPGTMLIMPCARSAAMARSAGAAT